MNNRTLYLLSFLTGLLLSLSWPHIGSLAPLVFIAWIPLLMVEETIFNNQDLYRPLHMLGCAFTAFFTWNLCCTWWVWNASAGGAAMAIISNSLLMATVFQLYHLARRRLKGKFSVLILISFWLSFELLHFHWDLTWSWLTLGNVFALNTTWIQWYEYTGVFGGSLWILLVNYLAFRLLSRRQELKRFWLKSVLLISLIVLPIIYSFYIYLWIHMINHHSGYETVVVQPNIDPYNEKFNGSFAKQLEKMLKLAETKITDNTDFVVFPETALTESVWENTIERTYSMATLDLFLKNHPRLKIMIGASTAYQLSEGETPLPTTKKFKDAEIYYNDYNTALYLDSTGQIGIYHKSKLVPGVEKMPFPMILKPLEKLAIDMGGTSGSLTEQDERTVFSSPGAPKIAPLICYESVFGEFTGKYVKNGAEILCIITNDGWWGDTPGYKQHLAYGRLRAIETRCYIARSANTGISCFIDQSGDVSQATKWWEATAIREELYRGLDPTFYTKYGDYLGWASAWLAGFLFLYSYAIRFLRRKT